MNEWETLSENTKLEMLRIGEVVFKLGDRVRLRPRGQADAFDLMLAGHDATIEAIEQDMENRVYIAVTVDDDPGRDLGMQRQPGHRFFFSPEEVEWLGESAHAG